MERVQALADISRSALCQYIVTTTKPVHRLQICPVVNNWGASPTVAFPKLSLHPATQAVVWESG